MKPEHIIPFLSLAEIFAHQTGTKQEYPEYKPTVAEVIYRKRRKKINKIAKMSRRKNR